MSWLAFSHLCWPKRNLLSDPLGLLQLRNWCRYFHHFMRLRFEFELSLTPCKDLPFSPGPSSLSPVDPRAINFCELSHTLTSAPKILSVINVSYHQPKTGRPVQARARPLPVARKRSQTIFGAHLYFRILLQGENLD